MSAHEPKIEIRLANAADAPAIARIHVMSWQAAYAGIMPAAFLAGLSVEKREQGWRQALEAGRPEVAIAFVDDEPAGWVAYGKSRDTDVDATWGEVEAIYLAPSSYRQGLGRLLMEHACDSLCAKGYAHVSLWVLINNVSARAFYERCGFVVDGQPKAFALGGAMLHDIRYSKPLA